MRPARFEIILSQVLQPRYRQLRDGIQYYEPKRTACSYCNKKITHPGYIRCVPDPLWQKKCLTCHKNIV